MPTPGYISIKGSKQGLITEGAFTLDSVGNLYDEGHEDEAMIFAFDHSVTVPTDPQSGQPSGQRFHKPFKFTTAFDKATPRLYRAMASEEVLTSVVMRLYRISIEGRQENFFTVKLQDATVVDIDANMPHIRDPATQDYTQIVEISLLYRSITWSHEIAATSFTDHAR